MIRFDTNNYEYNKSSPIGVYIIHGFSNTTYANKEIAKFRDKGFHTIANNLLKVMEQPLKNVIE